MTNTDKMGELLVALDELGAQPIPYEDEIGITKGMKRNYWLTVRENNGMFYATRHFGGTRRSAPFSAPLAPLFSDDPQKAAQGILTMFRD